MTGRGDSGVDEIMNGITKTFGRTLVAMVASVGALATFSITPALGMAPQEVNASGSGIDIAVRDVEITQVLEMLSLQTKKNIIASRNVSGTVTANLYNVTFYEALDNILKANGFRYMEEGNFIYVYTQAEYDEIIISRRKTMSRIFEIDYLSAHDASQFVTPLLSTSGAVSAVGDVELGFNPTIEDGGADSYAFNAKIVVNDYEEVLESIAALLKELDSPPQQVLVEATILQTRLNEDNAFGIDFSVIGGFNFSDLANPLSPVTDLLGTFNPSTDPAGAAQSVVGNTAGKGGLKIGVVSNDISVFLRLLDEVSDTTVLARPKVLVLNRQRAQVLVGTRIGYLSTTATETTTTQTVEFLDTGIQLIFRPFISKDGSIRMELAPSVSEAFLRDVNDPNGQTVTIPDEDTNEITTNIRVQNGKTIVLGGLFKESTQVTRKQVPFFGDIPIFGALFRGQEDVIRRSEITFLITPTIVNDEAMSNMGAESLSYMERAIVGARNGLLPFSRDFITTNYNMDAINAFNAGDTEMALFYINNSLRHHSNQQDILQLRRKVTGAKNKAYERSIMERVIRKELGSLKSDSDESSAYGTEPSNDRRTANAGSANFTPSLKSFDDYFGGMPNQFIFPSPVVNADGQE